MAKQALLAVLVGLNLTTLALCDIGEDKSPKKLQVVVIAVSNFPEDSGWRNPRLSESIKESASELENFFRDNFPDVELHILKTQEETTYEAIHQLLRDQLPQFGRDTLTLLFIISHGQSEKFPNPVYNRDLMIITSDTDKSEPNHKAIFVGKDILNELQGLPHGSTVLVFLDTCSSGSADSLQLRLQGALQNLLGTKMLIMASSLPEEKSYQATFTRALVGLWKEAKTATGCTGPFQAPALLREKMKTMVNLDLNEGFPRVIVPYYGNLCLELFSANSGLLLFHNTSTEFLTAQVRQIEGTKSSQLTSVPLEGEVITPINLDRAKYLVDVYWNQDKVFSETIDLKEHSVSFQPVGPAKGSGELGRLYERAAAFAEFKGASTEDVLLLKKQAYAFYVSAKDLQSANNVLQAILSVEGNNSSWNFIRERASQPLPTVLAQAEERKLDRVKVARTLELSGAFSAAAELYLQAAKDAKNKDQAILLAEEAYFAYGASSQPEMAKRVREEFKLVLNQVCKNCVDIERSAIRRSNLSSGVMFKDIATQKAISPP